MQGVDPLKFNREKRNELNESFVDLHGQTKDRMLNEVVRLGARQNNKCRLSMLILNTLFMV